MSTVLRGGRWGSLPARRGGRNLKRAAIAQQNLNVTEEYSVVCLVQSKNILGVAIYNIASANIIVSEVQIDDDFSCVSVIKEKCEPCTLVVPSSLSVNPKFMSVVDANNDGLELVPTTATSTEEQVTEQRGNQQEASSSDAANSESTSAVNHLVAHVANAEIQLNKAIQTCSLLSTLSMPNNLSARDKWSFLHHVFEGRDTAVRATGGLLSFCLHNNVLLTQGDVEDLICVNSITYEAVTPGMELSSVTAKAIQVFQDEAHPAGRGAGCGKEGISAFGLIKSHIKSSLGNRLLRMWFQCPLTEADEIFERQTLVAAFSNPANHCFRINIQDALRNVRNVPGILNRIRNISAVARDWESLLDSVKSFVIVIETFKSTARTEASVLNTRFYERLSEIDVDELRTIITWIGGVVDFEESKLENRICIKTGFSSDVDDMRYCLIGLDSLLTDVGVEEMKRIMANESSSFRLSSLIFTYHPNIGFLATLDHSDVERIGLPALEAAGYEYMFSSPMQGQFFKSQKCRKLDEDLGDVRESLIDLESKVVRFLENKVLPLADSAFFASSLVSELDCFQAMSAAADEYNWNRPFISRDAEGIKIENGRHALLELGNSPFVANSTFMRCGGVHVITGPNFSGKSVYLKQVALIVVLAQIGSCVPAENVEIRPVKAILTRISSSDAISKGFSTFFIDCAQVAAMLQSDRQPMLIILDEFGKGTSELDGIALLAATLRSFLNRSESTVMCLCATHQIEIFDNNILPLENPRLGTFSMEMLAVENTVTKTETERIKKKSARSSTNADGNISTSEERRNSLFGNEIDYVRTYRLLPGTICSDSRAIQCALEQGISREILSRAVQLKAALASETPCVIPVRWLNTRVRLCLQQTQDFLQMEF